MKLQGACPSCEHFDTLEADIAGVVRCAWIGCPRPDALWQMLNDPLEHKHVVTFKVLDDGYGFSIAHPLHERVNDNIIDCELHTYLAAEMSRTGELLKPPGVYSTRPGAVDDWIFTPL